MVDKVNINYLVLYCRIYLGYRKSIVKVVRLKLKFNEGSFVFNKRSTIGIDNDRYKFINRPN